MNRMTARIARIRSRATRGESITEVLVAIVVAGMAILLLATAIAMAASTNKQARDAMDDYFAANNGIVEGASANGTGTVALSDKATGEPIRLSGGSSVAVNYHISEQFDDTPVATYDVSGGGATP